MYGRRRNGWRVGYTARLGDLMGKKNSTVEADIRAYSKRRNVGRGCRIHDIMTTYSEGLPL